MVTATADRQGRSRLVSGLLKAGADVQTRDESGENGLDKAVTRGHRAAAEAFLNWGIIGYNREECVEQKHSTKSPRTEQLSLLMRCAAV